MANPFLDDKRKNLGLDVPRSYQTTTSIEDEISNYESQIEKYMQQTLDSTDRSVQQLENSEKIADSTARNLLEQREKLERTEQNLDQIHHTTRLTQRSLNSLKSVFGGFFKNKFLKMSLNSSNDKSNESKTDNRLNKVLENQTSSNFNSLSTSTLSEASRENIKGTRWEAMDNQIDDNLNEMSSRLGRLRTIGSALGDEIEDQNQLLNRIHQKAERNDAVVRHQDNQMRTLLGYND